MSIFVLISVLVLKPQIYHDIEKLFKSWKRRNLTLFGKSCEVNAIVLSKLRYAATILNFPDNDYIWKKSASNLQFHLFIKNKGNSKRVYRIDYQ